MTTCATCGESLAINTVKLHEVEVFCANELCDKFVDARWIERTPIVSVWIARRLHWRR